MHEISVTSISEYNQSYHEYRLVIKVYILLCVMRLEKNVNNSKYFGNSFDGKCKCKFHRSSKFQFQLFMSQQFECILQKISALCSPRREGATTISSFYE